MTRCADAPRGAAAPRLSFALFQPELGASARAAAIDAILERVGLTEQQHTRAGNQFIRGLSGGLKRRLSIAMALAKKPQVLLLDEPTTGVDSASASRMMTFLKEIAEQEKIVVVCTIHQPSASVFAGFDDNLVLASGRIAYFGPAKDDGRLLRRPSAASPPRRQHGGVRARPGQQGLHVEVGSSTRSSTPGMRSAGRRRRRRRCGASRRRR